MDPARIAPAPNPASAPQPVQASSDKAVADPKMQAGQQSRGSFAALLLALDDGATQASATLGQDVLDGAPAGSTSAPDASAFDATGAATLSDPAALAAWQGLWGAGYVPGVPQVASAGVAGAGVAGAGVATSGGAAAQDGPFAGGARGTAFDAPATIAQPLGLVAQTARLDRAVDDGKRGNGADFAAAPAQQGAQAALAMRRTLARSAAQGQTGLAGDTSLQVAGAPRVVVAPDSRATADAHMGANLQTTSSDAANPSARGAADAMPRLDAPSVKLQTAQAVAHDALVAAAAAGLPGASGGGDAQRSKSRASEGSATAPIAASTSSTFAVGLQQTTGSADASAVLADPAQAGAEDRLAQQISYWVHQTTQNAEMTVDQGGAAVQVSVSLTGNEARVHFMTDQAQARALLDANMAQLRELLQGQGLVLTGTSVGTTAQGQGQAAAGGQTQPQAAPGRSGRVQGVVVAAPAGAGLRASVDLQRALDVFA